MSLGDHFSQTRLPRPFRGYMLKIDFSNSHALQEFRTFLTLSARGWVISRSTPASHFRCPHVIPDRVRHQWTRKFVFLFGVTLQRSVTWNGRAESFHVSTVDVQYVFGRVPTSVVAEV